jgi:hypothetical protein
MATRDYLQDFTLPEGARGALGDMILRWGWGLTTEAAPLAVEEAEPVTGGSEPDPQYEESGGDARLRFPSWEQGLKVFTDMPLLRARLTLPGIVFVDSSAGSVAPEPSPSPLSMIKSLGMSWQRPT